VAACTARGITVTNTPIAVNDATADVGILLLLGALRRVTGPLISVQRGEFRGPRHELGHDPRGKVLGVLGMGGIGQAMARRAKAFGMSVQYHNRRQLTPVEEQGAKYVSFDELLATSDVLSLNLSLNKKTRHIIGTPEFEKMKNGIVIINTARGALIDEEALVKALEEGKVWAVGLDVFEEEPKIHPGLMDNEKVFMLPHLGTCTFETQKDMELLVLENLKLALTEGRVKTLVPEQKGAKL
jgi:glyoxylate reductase